MFDFFKYVDDFFTSLTNYLTYNYIFVIFVGLFLFTIMCVVFFTSRSYEAKLIKAIDKFNSYFIDNPQINEENLVAFNAKMKHKKVPKQLRKNWQQFVLYREDKASTYMSFENCVSNPIKNSTYTRDVKIMGILAWIFSLCALVLNCYYCYEVSDIATALSRILLTPIIILLLNYLVQIFLKLRHSAIVSDLFQNYQYFEVNIDKATETLPEYVDYEVLFDRNEIKKGIPILYAYLQKRAEEEQRELERARLKNVEHEKFNFDDQGIAASLVLERAMQEAENYIAERKKYTQDIGQINSDITQEDMNYREITKEYNRQMQVSKETFANFKSQLEEVTSTIEANYLKKQQQQELDRQRNLERDFDTATEKHKKVIQSYSAELDTIDSFIAQSRKALEDAMKSEFDSYSSKVYDEAKKVAEERVKEKLENLKHSITELEEKLVVKEQEVQEVYKNNQQINERLQETLEQNRELMESGRKKKKSKNSPPQESPAGNLYVPESLYNTLNNVIEQPVYEPVEEVNESVETFDSVNEFDKQPIFEDEFGNSWKNNFEDNNFETFEETPETNLEENNFETFEKMPETDFEEPQDKIDVNEFEYYKEDKTPSFEDAQNKTKRNNYYDLQDDEDFYFKETSDDKFKESDEFETFNDDEFEEDVSTKQTDDSIENKPTSRRGRPRKVVDVEDVQVEKKKPGRPRKQQTDDVKKEKRGRGRPRKVTTEVEKTKSKKGPGRPRKIQTEENLAPTVKKGPGRPRKENKSTNENKPTVKKGRGRPRKTVEQVAPTVKRGRGRPRKDEARLDTNISDIDAYLKEIDAQIAAENAKLEETQKNLAKEAKLKRKK